VMTDYKNSHRASLFHTPSLMAAQNNALSGFPGGLAKVT